METLALFSLEVVIEKLYVPGVTCRIPSIVCKLLDFPVLTINLIDAKSADKMRKTLTADPLWPIPSQFDCLKDLEDTFVFKRGKSCLFKMSPENLTHHLCNVPLYLLVLDSFPDTPKLLGSVSLPLDTAVKRVCSEFDEDRFNVPKVFANKGLLRIYSLMGKEIGYMTVGYRLLCLGSTLLTHITEKEPKDTADTVYSSTNENDRENKVDAKKSVEIQTENRDPGQQYSSSTVDSDKPVSGREATIQDEEVQSNITAEKEVSIYLCEPSEKENLTQNNIENNENSNKTQKNIENTEDSEKILERIKESANENTFFEHYHPPPMFYHNDGKPSFHIPVPSHEELNQLYMNRADGESDIFNEDIQSDFQEHQPTNSGSSLPLPFVQNNTSDEYTFESKFPLLTGILKELSSVDIPSLTSQICCSIKEQVPCKNYLSEGTQTSKKDTLAEKMKKAMLKQGSSATCRDWIRTTPRITSTKSLLQYGLTRTYTLRLEKIRSQKEESAKKEASRIGQKARFVNVMKNVSDTRAVVEEKQLVDTSRTPEAEVETPDEKSFKTHETVTIKEDKIIIEEEQVVHLGKDQESLKEESIITSLSIDEKKSVKISQASVSTAGSINKNDEERSSNVADNVSENHEEPDSGSAEEIPNIQNEVEASKHSQIEDYKLQMREVTDTDVNSVSHDSIYKSDREETSTIDTISSEADITDEEFVPQKITESFSKLEKMKSSTEDHDNMSVDSKISQILFPTDRSSKRVLPMLNRESINTESVSSYKPSDENIWWHTSGDQEVEYSDDFSSTSSTKSKASTEQPKNILRSENKLGYTIW
ncbi:microtubule-associated protein 10 [Octopus bimaculoides]|uniref:Uncharacterized protein n=1 Tax=Octopus bimaculoides TaxID=37653 RepID=A0A0L8GHY0_OCTBM|nr:microtubule-associated protein 10 [Octopus bimaculoides]|eukprot:XP_014780855.1 PREDICTED: microtubule-associated protein 10-like [Octopus bimaculoides]